MSWEVPTMKLKTSFFNPTVLRKDLTRFAPLWGLFLVFKLLAVLLSTGEPAYLAGNVAESFQGLGVAQFIYGGLCALLLFGNLFDTRTAYTLHALPLRREGWFFTHLCSGILFYLIPAVGEALFCMVGLWQFWYLALLRLAVGLVMFLFFFGIGAFSCLCAGTRLGALAVYSLTNFLSMVILYLVWTFYSPLLPGILINSQLALYLCPVVAFTRGRFVLVDSRRYVTTNYDIDQGHWKAEFQGFIGNDWLQLLFAGLIAVAFLGVALLLYRRRRIESAGDFISARFMVPVFLIFYTLLFGATLYLMGDKSYIFLMIGFGIGFFTGLMLLHKKVNVFRKKAWLTLGVFSVLFTGTLVITAWDPFGVVEFVPAPQKVQSATISQGYADLFFDFTPLESVVLETPEELELLEQLHKTFLSEEDVEDSYVTTGELTISYKLKDGRQVNRQYDIPRYSKAPEQLRVLLSRLDMFEDTQFLKNVVSVYYSDDTDVVGLPGALPRVQIANPSRYGKDFHFGSALDVQHTVTGSMDQDAMALGLWDAIWQDCLAGNTAQDWDYHSQREGELEIEYLNEDGEIETEYFSVYEECTHTIEYLKSLAS